MSVTTLDAMEMKKKMTRRYCSALNCRRKNFESPELSFFRFPKDKDRCKQWVTNCRRKDLLYKDAEYLFRNVRLCSLHFEDEMFANNEKNRLRGNAVPTIFNVPYKASETIETATNVNKLGNKQTTMPNDRLRISQSPTLSDADHVSPLQSDASSGSSNVENRNYQKLSLKLRRNQRIRNFKCSKRLSDKIHQRSYCAKIRCLQVQLKILEQELQKSKGQRKQPTNREILLQELESELTEGEMMLMRSFIRKSEEEYSDKEKCFFALFYMHGPKGYEFLRQRQINIPSPVLINLWMEEDGLHP